MNARRPPMLNPRAHKKGYSLPYTFTYPIYSVILLLNGYMNTLTYIAFEPFLFDLLIFRHRHIPILAIKILQKILIFCAQAIGNYYKMYQNSDF